MTWFWIALIGPALYAFANHTDKYLISRYFKGGEVGALIIFSGIFSVVALPVIYWLAPTTLAVTPVRALILAVNGSLTVIGVLLFLLIASYRRQFLAVLKLNRGFVLGLNSGNEVATIIADGVTYYASLLAPVALVLTVNGFQPVFVFIYGVLLTLFLPRIAQERLVGPLLAQKILAIALVFAGSVMIGFA